MAVHVRLQRHGRRNRPFYHIVAADHRKPRNGACIEKLGYYDPSTNPSTAVVHGDRVQHWYERGAQLSSTVRNILKAQKITVQRKATAG